MQEYWKLPVLLQDFSIELCQIFQVEGEEYFYSLEVICFTESNYSPFETAWFFMGALHIQDGNPSVSLTFSACS